jgi:uncharacterized cupredoxin-like copper-binding protein
MYTLSTSRVVAIVLAAAVVAAPAAAQDHAHHGTGAARAVAAGARVLEVDALDFAFRSVDTVEAGYVTIRMANKGPDLHHVALMKLEQGKTLKDLFEAFGKTGTAPAWATDVGGPNAVVPGDTAQAAVELEAGRYALLCVIHGADKVMHAAKGMARELVVVPARARGVAARPVVPDAEVVLDDYAFRFGKPLGRGKQVVRVKNVAAQAHEIFFVQLAPGRTAKDVVAFIMTGQGAPPGRPVGGTTGIAKGGYNDVALDLAPGRYALICFYPDAKDRRPHLEHGMIDEIEVK